MEVQLVCDIMQQIVVTLEQEVIAHQNMYAVKWTGKLACTNLLAILNGILCSLFLARFFKICPLRVVQLSCLIYEGAPTLCCKLESIL